MQRIIHHLEYRLAEPLHPIKILLVGVGGTGSQVLSCLARISYALKKLGHPGFHVIALDGDKVEEFNVGRQLFSASEIGYHKSVCSISKINRFFGLSWEADTELLKEGYLEGLKYSDNPNLIISCVDNVATRRIISKSLLVNKSNMNREYRTFYWMDFGNTQNTGQVIIGSGAKSETPSLVDNPQLRTVFDVFPKMEKYEKNSIQGPSCSMAEALGKQDLFINSMLAQAGCNLLWKLFYHKEISENGVFLNLSPLNVAPLLIKPKVLKHK